MILSANSATFMTDINSSTTILLRGRPIMDTLLIYLPVALIKLVFWK